MSDLGLPSRGLVKICGVREPEHAIAAARCGVDLIGFMFAPSKRRVSLEQAKACVDAMRSAVSEGSPRAVGVFVDPSPAEIATAVDVIGLDLVQLHVTTPADLIGDRALQPGFGETSSAGAPHDGSSKRVPVIRAIRTPPGTTSVDVLRIVGNQPLADAPVAWLIDGYRPGMHGGTGVQADWRLAAEVAAVAPVILAGGLTADNVPDAIRIVRPLGVDVSGGVETDGQKDPAKIAAFVSAARAAFAAAGYGKESRH